MNVNPSTIEEVIAVRTLSLETEKGVEVLSVLIGKPERSPDSTAYRCPFQIRGVGSENVKYAVGADAVQVIQLVMYMIGADLGYLNEQCGGRLRWSNKPDLGFPEILSDRSGKRLG
jgi:hypothetical protein